MYRFSLKELWISWIIWLGVLLWIASLFLPVTRGENSYSGIQMLLGSIYVAVAPPSLMGKPVIWMSVVAAVLHLLVIVGLAMWLCRTSHVGLVRVLSLCLILGACAFKLAEFRLFGATAAGFNTWVASLLCIGVGLLVSANYRKVQSGETRFDIQDL